jgi:hypothetical protein
MIGIVEASGMDLVTTIDADTHEDPTDESERIYIIARKNSDNNITVYKEEE